MLPMFTVDPPRPLLGCAAGHGLGEEEDGPVQAEAEVTGRAVALQERLGDEQPGRADQQADVAVLAGQLPADLST
jgi:hypothetical protein